MALKTGADWVLYQDLADLEAAVQEVNPDIPRFDSSCFRSVRPRRCWFEGFSSLVRRIFIELVNSKKFL